MINKRFNQLQTILSITLFLIVFFICYHTTNFDLAKIPLSYFGAYNEYKFFWNLILMVLSYSIFINVRNFIYHSQFRHKRELKLVFFLLSCCLFLVGLIPMPNLIHSMAAYIYFFGYPLAIFLMIQDNRSHLNKLDWGLYTVIAVAMMLLPLIFLEMFTGKAYAEISNVIIMIIFNLLILD